MEKEVAVDNSEFANMRFVTGPKLRAQMKDRDIAAVDGTLAAGNATGRFLWDNGDAVIGYPSITSNQMPEALTVGNATCSSTILGAFQHCLVGFWGPSLEIIVDPYSLSKSGGVRIVALVDVDMALRYATAFCRVVDAKL